MNNMGKYIVFSFLTAGIIVAGAVLHYSTTGNTPPLGPSRIITDMCGRQVSVPDNPSRILCLSAMADNVIVKLGLSGKLAAIDQYGTIIPGTKKAEVVGKGSALSIEKILELKVDIAFIWWYQDDVAAMLKKYSIPVVRLKSCRLNNYPQTVMLIGRCLNAENAANTMIRNFNKQLKTLPKTKVSNARKVYLELYSPYRTAGKDSYANDLIEAAGGHNIATGISGGGLISAEEIIQQSPQVILFINGFAASDEIGSRPGFKTLPAVKQNRIYGINRQWFIAGVDPAEAVNKIKQTINGKGN